MRSKSCCEKRHFNRSVFLVLKTRYVKDDTEDMCTTRFKSVLREELPQQMFIICNAKLMRERFITTCALSFTSDCGTADRGSTTIQHLFHDLFVDCVTTDRGSTRIQHLSHYLFVDCVTADRGSTTIQPYFIIYSSTA